MTRVKICGLRSADDARDALAAGADFLGLVFADSPRRATLDEADAIRRATPGARRVGVFVDAAQADVDAAIEAGDLAYVQFHGHESPERCAAQTLPVIKALRVGADPVDAALEQYRVDAYLVDGFSEGRAGGTGTTFDWQLARPWTAGRRLFLAGGLAPENVADAIRVVRPFAVDVASGVELAPGRKDRARVRAFIQAVRRFDGEI